MLFMVSNAEALPSCLNTAAVDDVVLLLDQAVHAVDCGVSPGAVRLYVRAADWPVDRGCPEGLRVIDDAGFVDLVTMHAVVIAWR
ncbi:MAG: hypothetical protein ACO3P1_10570 [Pseudomonadales bacterium]